MEKKEEMVALLLKYGANPNRASSVPYTPDRYNKQSYTPLELAIEFRYDKIILFLIEHGASL